MDLYYATSTMAFGTGAPQHKIAGATRTAMSRSPKTAVRLAREAAERACGEATNWGLVLDEIKLVKNGKIIFNSLWR